MTICSRNTWRAGLLAIACTIVLVYGCPASQDTPEPVVHIAAASSMAPLVPELTALFQQLQPDIRLEWTLGATGMLALQIENGAPYAALLAADYSYMDRLQQGGFTDGSPFAFAQGELILFIRTPDHELANDALLHKTVQGIVQRKGRIVLADPAAAPYGRAAKQALVQTGLWHGLQEYRVVSRSAAQALQFTSAAADAGFLSRTALQDERIQALLQSGATWLPVDQRLYQPIVHYAVALKGQQPLYLHNQRIIHELMQHPQAQAALSQQGYVSIAMGSSLARE